MATHPRDCPGPGAPYLMSNWVTGFAAEMRRWGQTLTLERYRLAHLSLKVLLVELGQQASAWGKGEARFRK